MDTSKTLAEAPAIHVSDATRELVIRHGDAALIREHDPINLSGVIGAPWQFLSQKLATYQAVNAHVQLDRDNASLTLVLNDGDDLKDTITGKLTPSKEIEAFKINTDHLWPVGDLRKLARMTRHLFTSREEQSKLILELEQFKAKVTKTFEDAKTFDGNQRKAFEVVVAENNLSKSFSLSVPLYKGAEPQPFTVEVGAEVKGNDVVFFLHSIDLIELQFAQREALLRAEAEKFEAWGCSVVWVS